MKIGWRKGQDSNLRTRNPVKGLAIPGSTNYAYLSMAATTGFEPVNNGVKAHRLTSWLRRNIEYYVRTPDSPSGTTLYLTH